MNDMILFEWEVCFINGAWYFLRNCLLRMIFFKKSFDMAHDIFWEICFMVHDVILWVRNLFMHDIFWARNCVMVVLWCTIIFEMCFMAHDIFWEFVLWHMIFFDKFVLWRMIFFKKFVWYFLRNLFCNMWYFEKFVLQYVIFLRNLFYGAWCSLSEKFVLLYMILFYDWYFYKFVLCMIYIFWVRKCFMMHEILNEICNVWHFKQEFSKIFSVYKFLN